MEICEQISHRLRQDLIFFFFFSRSAGCLCGGENKDECGVEGEGC